MHFTFDQDTDFSKFKTYKWVSVLDASEVDDRWDKRIEDVVDAELAKKGLTKTNTDTSDLDVGCQVAIGAETQSTPYNTSWGYTWVLDIYDSKNHNLIWRGDVSKTVEPEATIDRQQRKLASAITELLRHFPPAISKAK